MPDQPLLTPEAVREWVGDFEIGKGRPYADAAVYGCRWEDDTGTLFGSVRGTRTQPYQVFVNVGSKWDCSANGAVKNAHCTCPVGENGKCKHVAAVLLAYLEDPARFPETSRAEANLDERPKDELLALINRLLHFAPELKPLLVVPMPGFVTEDVSPDVFHALALDAIRTTRPHDDRVEEDAIDALWPLIWLGDGYRTRNHPQAAEALTEGLAWALRASGLNRDRLREVLAKQNGFWDQLRKRLSADETDGKAPPPF